MGAGGGGGSYLVVAALEGRVDPSINKLSIRARAESHYAMGRVEVARVVLDFDFRAVALAVAPQYIAGNFAPGEPGSTVVDGCARVIRHTIPSKGEHALAICGRGAASGGGRVRRCTELVGANRVHEANGTFHDAGVGELGTRQVNLDGGIRHRHVVNEFSRHGDFQVVGEHVAGADVAHSVVEAAAAGRE